MQSFLKRVGGKRLLVKKILPLIPTHITYVEPFFGAGWVFFAKKPSPVEVINDADGELVNLWRVVKNHPGELRRWAAMLLWSRKMWQERALFARETDVLRAVAFWFEVETSFGGMRSTFGYTRKPPRRGNFLRDFRSVSKRLRGVIVECDDFQAVIERYDSPETFFYLDPPYLGTTTESYANDWKPEDQERLERLLMNLEGKWLMSLGGSAVRKKVFRSRGWSIMDVSTRYSLGGSKSVRKRRQEVLVANYPLGYK